MFTVISGIVLLPLFLVDHQAVIAGLDPAIHHLKDGSAGQARARNDEINYPLSETYAKVS
jgi:hypothetical protein